MAQPANLEESDHAPVLTLRDSLIRSRLIHREARLQLVLAALRDRMHELDRCDARIPEPLLAAHTGFQEELAEVRNDLLGRTPRHAGFHGGPDDQDDVADPHEVREVRRKP